jgi:hypothetical protein
MKQCLLTAMAFYGVWFMPSLAQAELIAETLHQVSVETGEITFTVTGTGCTSEKDFELLIAPGEIPKVTVIRTRPDRCKRTPQPVSIKKPLIADGRILDAPITIRNPMSAPPDKTGKRQKMPPQKI